MIIFETLEERDDFLATKVGVERSAAKVNKRGNILSVRWPIAPREDLAALRFEEAEA